MEKTTSLSIFTLQKQLVVSGVVQTLWAHFIRARMLCVLLVKISGRKRTKRTTGNPLGLPVRPKSLKWVWLEKDKRRTLQMRDQGRVRWGKTMLLLWLISIVTRLRILRISMRTYPHFVLIVRRNGAAVHHAIVGEGGYGLVLCRLLLSAIWGYPGLIMTLNIIYCTF